MMRVQHSLSSKAVNDTARCKLHMRACLLLNSSSEGRRLELNDWAAVGWLLQMINIAGSCHKSPDGASVL